MKKLIFIIYLVSVSVINAQDYNVIFWDDLKPKVDFKDPFKEMNAFQLKTLGRLARLRVKLQKENTTLSEEELAEKTKLEETLTQNNIDFEYLFSSRNKIVEQRKQAIAGLNTKLDNMLVELSGYLLPLNFEKGQSNEFLLVPWVGACIHTPPPPKNQIIYVKTDEWLTAPGLFDAVVLMGKIMIIEKKANLYLEDGSAIIETGYTVENAIIQKM